MQNTQAPTDDSSTDTDRITTYGDLPYVDQHDKEVLRHLVVGKPYKWPAVRRAYTTYTTITDPEVAQDRAEQLIDTDLFDRFGERAKFVGYNQWDDQ
jgi:hypothetical protein